MTHDCADQNSLEQELSIARDALREGDAVHAAHHLANAAQEAPSHDEVTSLLRELLVSVDDPAELVPVLEKRHLSQVVLRALLLVRIGRLTDAFVDGVLAHSYGPSTGYIDAMLTVPLADASLRGVDADRVGDAMVAAVSREEQLEPADLGPFRAGLLLLCDLLGPRHTASEPLAFAECMLARRSGDPDRALRAVDQRYTGAGSYRTAIGVANAHRAEGRVDEALHAYERALTFDPDDAAARLDAGDTLFDCGRLREAQSYYEAARAVDPPNDWALSSLAFIDFMLRDDKSAGATLRTRAAESQRAAYLLSITERYSGWLPYRPESTLKALAQADARGDGLTEMAVSSLEAPSAVAIVRRQAPGIELSFGQCDGLDPRVARGKVSYVLWKYRRRSALPFARLVDLAEPAMPPPSSAVATAIAELARTPYSAGAWFEASGAVKSTIRRDDLRDVLA